MDYHSGGSVITICGVLDAASGIPTKDEFFVNIELTVA
jgi:hypothetical protein